MDTAESAKVRHFTLKLILSTQSKLKLNLKSVSINIHNINKDLVLPTIKVFFMTTE